VFIYCSYLLVLIEQNFVTIQEVNCSYILKVLYTLISARLWVYGKHCVRFDIVTS
jgi:hypothetical protein